MAADSPIKLLNRGGKSARVAAVASVTAKYRRCRPDSQFQLLVCLVSDSDAIALIRVLLVAHTNGLDVRVLAEACGLLRYSCGNPKLSRQQVNLSIQAASSESFCRQNRYRNLLAESLRSP